MANLVNYAQRFERQLKQKYKAGLKTAGLTTADQRIRFLNANTVQIPYVIVQGYKDHGRNGGFNRQDLENKYFTKTLEHDRDVEFFVDSMDVEESNLALSAANITNTFEEEQAIPETDVYRLSKLYAEHAALGGTVDSTPITPANALLLFDEYMQEMDDDEVPEEGRILFSTPDVFTSLKQAQQISRSMAISSNNGAVNRVVRSLDDVSLVKVPSARMKTAYDFSDGFKPAAGAGQMNMILVHPRSILAVDKHTYIKLWAPGEHTQGDGWLYQNRKYGDLFIIDTRKEGVYDGTFLRPYHQKYASHYETGSGGNRIMAGEKLVELMQQAARGEQARSAPTDFVYGMVTSVSPLSIQVEGKYEVGEGNLILSALCKPFITDLLKHKHKQNADGETSGDGTAGSGGNYTDIRLDPVTVWRGLEAGDKVRMLQCNSGQKFYVLDREGSLP